jgi:hypothetical protein
MLPATAAALPPLGAMADCQPASVYLQLWTPHTRGMLQRHCSTTCSKPYAQLKALAKVRPHTAAGTAQARQPWCHDVTLR